jgi:hypothetical protein
MLLIYLMEPHANDREPRANERWRASSTWRGGIQLGERGGVLLGQHEDGRTMINGAVFPPQVTATREHCSFDVSSIEIVSRARRHLADEDTRNIGGIIGWVHSHPGMGVFLSDTDVETLRSWISLDARAIALVADPFAKPGRLEFGWWNAPAARCEAPISDSDGTHVTIQQASLLAQLISDDAYARGRWDILAPGGIITVFPTSASANNRSSWMAYP